MSLMYFRIVKSLFLVKAAGVSYQKEFKCREANGNDCWFEGNMYLFKSELKPVKVDSNRIIPVTSFRCKI